jgi:ankyrin repeat protein/predicted DNA-binding WGR domain protein
MIEYNYDLSLAILDCFNHRKFNYVYTLLLKKSQAGVYNAKNDQQQNLAHLLAKSASHIEENLFNKILSKMEENNLEFELLDIYKKSPLHYAADAGCLKMIQILLEKGLDVNAVDSEGQSALSIIVKNYLYKTGEFIQLAQSYGLDLNKKFLHKGVQHSLLTYIISEQLDFKVFNRLANLGADLNATDANGWTPLIYLIRQNREADLRNYLVTFPGVNLHVKDVQGRTIIHHVVKPRDIGSFENVSMLDLLAYKVNVNTPDSQGYPPIYYANSQSSGRMKKKLIDWGANQYADQPALKKTATTWLSESSFPTNSYNYEEDFESFVEECKLLSANQVISAEEKCAVDDCATGNYEVVYDQKDPFDALLVKVDISKGFYSGNTFYKIQILRERVRDIYVLFTKWGRVGDDGQYQQTPFAKLDECKHEFCSVFKAKSGNLWENRHKFEKVDKKYRLLPFSKKVKFESYLKAFNYRDPALPSTQLTKSVFKFIRRICNSKVFSNTIKYEFNIDENVLPLQSLTRERLLDAETIVKSIEQAIKEYNESKKKNDLNLITEFAEELTKLTSQYYELIPSTKFTTQSIPPITNLHEVVQLKRMLNDLLYFEIAIKLLCGATFRIKQLNPMDYIHCSLAVKIMSVAKKSDEYQIIE